MTTLYHVTPFEIWSKKIQKSGLVPRKEKRGIHADSNEKRIYFFDDLATVEDAMVNWFLEEFPDVRYFAVIEVRIPIEVDVFEDPEIAGSFYVSERIPAQNLRLIEKVDAGEE